MKIPDLRSSALLQHQMLVALRRPRSYQVFSLSLLLIGFIAILILRIIWPAATRSGELSQVGRLLLLFYAPFSQFLICLLMPSLGVQAIAQEKQNDTLELFLTTPARPIMLVLSKVSAGLAMVILAIFGAAPLVGLSFVMGGVGPDEVLQLTLSQIVLCFLGLTLGVWAGAKTKTMIRGVILAYMIFAFLLAFCVLVTAIASGSGIVGYVMNVLDLGPRRPRAGMFWIQAQTPWMNYGVIMLPWFADVILIALTFLILLRIPRHLTKEPVVARPRTWKPIRLRGKDSQLWSLLGVKDDDEQIQDHQNPIYICERQRFLLQVTRRYIDAPSILWLFSSVCFLFYAFWPQFMLNCCLMLILFFTPVVGATILASEHERLTWDSLRVTLLSPIDILCGKFRLVFGQSLIHLAAFYVPMFPLLILIGGLVYLASPGGASYNLSWNFGAVLVRHVINIPIVVMTAVTVTSITLYCSSMFRRGFIAVIAGYLASTVLLLGPKVLWFIMMVLHSPGFWGNRWRDNQTEWWFLRILHSPYLTISETHSSLMSARLGDIAFHLYIVHMIVLLIITLFCLKGTLRQIYKTI